MKYFFDTEFIENGSTIDLVSIGIITGDSREFYAQNQECDWSLANDWVARNVLIHLSEFDMGRRMPANYSKHGEVFDSNQTGGWWRQSGIWRKRHEISKDILAFVGFPETEGYGKPEFWAYYADYDWVVLCQLYGTMMDLPEGWPMYCRDIKQFCDDLGNPKLPEQEEDEHHSLADARWNKKAFEFLERYASSQTNQR